MAVIGITGGTGFIGRRVAALLAEEGHEVIIFTRRPGKSARQAITYAHWDPLARTCDIDALSKTEGMIHLAGAGIADKRWTAARKEEIVVSRVAATGFIVSMLRQHAPGCKTLISASASGFYGPDRASSMPFTEDAPPAHDFLGDTCRQWEAAAAAASAFVRTVILRFGIVLGKESGAFPRFAGPLSFGVMPILGSGRQVISWIEAGDLARLIVSSLNNAGMSGIYNAVAPNPVTNRQLMNTIALVKGGIKIPVPVPAFLLKIILGEMSEEVLKSCTMSAQKTLDTGFRYEHPGILSAVKIILGK